MLQRCLMIATCCLWAVTSLGSCTDASSPLIQKLVPGSGSGGDVVHVVGEGFAPGDLTVAFGGVVARIIERSAQRAIVVVPIGLSGLVPVVVKIDGHVSRAMEFWSSDVPTSDGG